MTTISQTDIISTFTSVDGDKSISISQTGLSLKRDILTTVKETIITPIDITDVNTGNVITMDRLTYLPIGLSSLEAPPNLTTLHIQDTILVDKIADINSTTVAFNSIVLNDGIENTTNLTPINILVNNANGGGDPISTTIAPNYISFLTGDAHIFCNMYGNQLTYSDNTYDDNSQLNNYSLQFLANTIPSVISNSGGQSLSITTDNILNITGDVGITLDTPNIDFLHTTTTTSIGNHNADIQSTTNGVSSTTFLKVKLNGNDIWIPYFTTDPSL